MIYNKSFLHSAWQRREKVICLFYSSPFELGFSWIFILPSFLPSMHFDFPPLTWIVPEFPGFLLWKSTNKEWNFKINGNMLSVFPVAFFFFVNGKKTKRTSPPLKIHPAALQKKFVRMRRRTSSKLVSYKGFQFLKNLEWSFWVVGVWLWVAVFKSLNFKWNLFLLSLLSLGERKS